MKSHNIIYQTTNLINGKIYIGRHSTNNLNDGYLGSGKEFQRDLKLLGKDAFTRIVLFDFSAPEEMIAKEIELLTEEFVSRDDNYNLGGGQGGLFTHGEEARQKLREANTGFVTAKDKDGNTCRISKNDPRYQSGELVHMLHGMVSVKDSEGNTFCVDINDSRRLSGELVGPTAGTKRPEETTAKHIEFMKKYWAEMGGHTDEAKKKCRDANVGKVSVRDKDGNVFRTSVDDPRYLNGELICAFLGTKLSDTARKKISENKKGNIWISHIELNKTKLVKPDEIDKYLIDGWEIGRIQPENIGEKIKAGRKPGSWMINLETKETKIILKTLVEEYLLNGWILGRII